MKISKWTVQSLVANNRMKGLEVEYRTVDVDGKLSTNTYHRLSDLPNCSHWTEWKHCPANTVAAGVLAYISDGAFLAPQRFFHSIDLMCGTLEIRET